MQFWRPGDAFGPSGDDIVGTGHPKKLLSEDRKIEILYALEKGQNVIVHAHRASQLSKDIPKHLVASGWSIEGKSIAVALPRQVAVVSTSVQVAQDIGLDESHLGGDYVGFVTQSNAKRSSSTKIVYFTNQGLLRDVLSEPLLSSISVVVLDSFHERSIAGDLLLGFLKKIQQVRQDLRIVLITSDPNTSSLCSYLGTAHTTRVDLGCRQFPVTIFHSKEPVEDYLQAALGAVKDSFAQWHRTGQPRASNVLVFVHGAEETQRLCDIVNDWFSTESHGSMKVTFKKRAIGDSRRTSRSRLVAVPLYAGLNLTRQMEALSPIRDDDCFRIVIATNIAELLVTVDGIGTVIDCGFEKTSVFDPKLKTTRVSAVPISLASAQRRASCAGLKGPGTCFRLYTHRYQKSSFPERHPPDILRCELTEMVLTLKAIGVRDVMSFGVLDRPDEGLVVDALERLHYLGAISSHGSLTADVGMRMSASSLHPRVMKCIIVGESYGIGRAMAAVAAMLEIKHVIFRYGRQAWNPRAPFAVAEGDVLTLLNVWRRYVNSGLSETWCHEHGINASAMQRARNSFSKIVKSTLNPEPKRGSFAAAHKAIGLTLSECICRSITAGFFENAAMVEPNGSYLVALSGRRVHVHKRSVLHQRMPKWIIYIDLVQKSDCCEMREVTVIQPQWLTEYAPQLFERLKTELET